MKTKFKNKDGSLTLYSLTCGYIEKETKGENYKTLEKETIFHVKYNINGVFLWESFDTLTQARELYKSIKL